MSKKQPSKNTVSHIIINRFSPEERRLIRKACKLAQLRRPAIYHDAIVTYAKEITDESNVTEASGNLPPDIGGTREEVDGREHDSPLQAGPTQ